MKYSKIGVSLLSVAAAALLTACGNQQSSSEKKQFSWSTGAELSTIDMSKASDTISYDQLRNTMEGLYRTGKSGKIIPGLATSSTVSKDGKTYTFTLRKSRWSDGKLQPRTLFIPGGGPSTLRWRQNMPTFLKALRMRLRLSMVKSSYQALA